MYITVICLRNETTGEVVRFLKTFGYVPGAQSWIEGVLKWIDGTGFALHSFSATREDLEPENEQPHP